MWLTKGGDKIVISSGNELYWSTFEESTLKEWKKHILEDGYNSQCGCISSDGLVVCVSATLSQNTSLLLFKFPPDKSEPFARIQVRRCLSDCRFTPDNKHIITADRSGQVCITSLYSEGSVPVPITAHLSMVLVCMMNPTSEYLVTADRDEKIRVSRYPDCENIHAYCLGHKEFVSCFEFCPNNGDLAASGSGDGQIILWKWQTGQKLLAVSPLLTENETTVLSESDIPSLPISSLVWNSSRIFAALKRSRRVWIWTVTEEKSDIRLDAETTIETSGTVIGMVVHENYLLVACGDSSLRVETWNISNPKTCELIKSEELVSELGQLKDLEQDFAVLYKRKFDNVTEYHERKKQRLEKIKN